MLDGPEVTVQGDIGSVVTGLAERSEFGGLAILSNSVGGLV